MNALIFGTARDEIWIEEDTFDLPDEWLECSGDAPLREATRRT